MGKKNFYAVAVGRNVGIYRTWDEAKVQVSGYPNAKYKGFSAEKDAIKFIQEVTHPHIKHEKEIDTILCDTVYTDGSCIDRIGGIGAVLLLKDGRTFHMSGPLRPGMKATNNTAELYAIWVVLTMCKGDVVIKTDSKYSKSALTKPRESYQPGSTLKNKELILEILDLLPGRQVTIHHVSAHSGVEHNEMADHLANFGSTYSEIKLIEHK